MIHKGLPKDRDYLMPRKYASMSFMFEHTFLSLSVFFVSGAVWGSFLGATIDRLAEDVPLFSRSRSFCVFCGTTLSPRDLIPVWSWLCLRGKCRTCQASIPVRIFLYEALSGGFFAIAGERTTGASLFLLLIFWSCVLILGALDWRRLWLPGSAMLVLAFFGILYQEHVFYDRGGLYGALAGGLVLALVRFFSGPHKLGSGDIWLASALGLWVGWDIGPVIFGGSLLTLIFFSLSPKKGERTPLPLGTGLCVSAVLTIVYRLFS